MAREREPLDWRDASVGFALIAAVTAAALTVFFLDEFRRALEEGPRLVAVSASAPDLAPGSAVWVAGRPAGRVLSVSLRPPHASGAENVVIRAVLQRRVGEVIRRDARARIQPADLLEPVVLAIDPGSATEPPYDFADTLVAAAAAVEQDELLARLDTLRADADRRSELAVELDRRLSEGRGSIAALRRDRRLVESLERQSREVGRLALGREAGGSVGALLRDPTLAVHLDSARARAARLRAVRDSIAALRAPGAADALPALERLQNRLGRLDAELRAGMGTAGRGLYDDELGRQARLLRARLDSVVSELLGDPRRWLRVRIF